MSKLIVVRCVDCGFSTIVQRHEHLLALTAHRHGIGSTCP